MMHQCPKCELRFERTTELDDHCRNDHPQFHHEYPVKGVHHDYDVTLAEPAPALEPEVVHEPTRAERTFGRPPERSW